MSINRKTGMLCSAVVAILFVGCGERTTEQGDRQPLPQEKHALVLNDVRAYASKPTGVKNSGLVVFKQDPANSLKLDLEAEITQAFDSTGGKLANSQSGLYFSGVRHKFLGTCHFPVSPEDIVDGELQFIIQNIGDNAFTQVMTEDGWIAMSGTVAIRGPGFIIKAQDSPSIRIESSDERPLVFEVTSDGYRYVEGKGHVVTLQGKTLEFPK
jgi:hypothetical protein